MIHVDAVKIAMPLKRKFVISKGEATVKTNILAIINNRYNGEASGSVYYGPSINNIETELIKGFELIKSYSEINMEVLNEINSKKINTTVKGALMGAMLNYISGESHRYPWEILELGSPVGIRSSVTISIDKPEKMIDRIKNSEFPIIKIKMGNEEDVMILDALKDIDNREIRVDANGAWSCAKAEEMIFQLSKNGVKVIEQPTNAEFVKEWPYLKKKIEGVELIMDEGLNDANDYNLYKEYIDGINVKMEKCGGILEAVKLAKLAHKDKKKVMLGCMVASSIGIAQPVYMSSQADYFDLDGPLLLENDIASGIRYDKESINVDREIIGGPKLRRDMVERYIDK
ncbi:MAG: enolase C-terminal domain-like protein [candidate division Zixibacteria bacterium]|nr:enolase C-terminal domain-like protein [candidate division Zixibacteria bacterium]